MVGNWLYGVTRQTAVRLRATAAKRGMRETQMTEMPEPVVLRVRFSSYARLILPWASPGDSRQQLLRPFRGQPEAAFFFLVDIVFGPGVHRADPQAPGKG